MIKYILGFFLNFFNLRVSKFSFIDNKSVINKKAIVYRACQVFRSTIDAHTYIAPNSCIIHSKIGKFCSISKNVYIGLPKHNFNVLSTSPLFLSENNALKTSWVKGNSFEEFENTIIGNDVWIGMNVMIKGGVKISDGAVIGAGSIVTKDVPPFAIVVGCPAKILKYRFSSDIIEKIMYHKWWNLNDKLLMKNIDLFRNEDFFQSYDFDKLQK